MEFKTFDKRKFRISDIADVIDWLQYVDARNREAIEVIRRFRDSSAINAGIVKNMLSQQSSQNNAIKEVYGSSEEATEAEPILVKSVDLENEEILAELKAQVAEEEAASIEEKESNPEVADHLKEIVKDYDIRWMPNFRRYVYRYRRRLIRADNIPVEVKAYLDKLMASDPERRLNPDGTPKPRVLTKSGRDLTADEIDELEARKKAEELAALEAATGLTAVDEEA